LAWHTGLLKSIFWSGYEQSVEKAIFLRLIKNAQMQVELCEIPFEGAPEIFS